MQWLRLYHDTPTDPKWRLVAVESGQTVASVLAVWTCMMVNASQAEPRGTLSGWNDRIIGASLDLKGDAVAAIRSAMQGVVLEGDLLTGWERRQRSADSSADRVRQYRERLHAGTGRKRTPYDTKEVIERDGGMCVYCGSTENLCVDHMVPIVLGGDHQSDNFACACKKCNSGKAGRTPEQAGYTIISADALARYRGAVERMGINRVTVTPEDITVGTPTEQNVTVTSDGVTVTSDCVTVSPLRAQTTDSDTEQESKEESPLPPKGVSEPELFRHPDPAVDKPKKSKKAAAARFTPSQLKPFLDEFEASYPVSDEVRVFDTANKTIARLVNGQGVDPKALVAAAGRYAQAMAAKGRVGTQFIMKPNNWLTSGEWKQYDGVHHFPNQSKSSAYDPVLSMNEETMEQWRARTAAMRAFI